MSSDVELKPSELPTVNEVELTPEQLAVHQAWLNEHLKTLPEPCRDKLSPDFVPGYVPTGTVHWYSTVHIGDYGPSEPPSGPVTTEVYEGQFLVVEVPFGFADRKPDSQAG
jgi:hypothetical protein